MNILLKLWKNLHVPTDWQLFVLKKINDHFLIGVTGVIFNDKNEVLLVKHTYRRVAWSLPGGYLHASEHPKTGLQREIFEETRFRVKILRIIMTKTDHKGRLDMSYCGIYKKGSFKPSDEVSAYKFCSIENLPKLIKGQHQQILEGLRRKLELDEERKWKNTSTLMKKVSFISSFFWYKPN